MLDDTNTYSQMPKEAIACFQSLLSKGSIDPDNGIISGVHVMELGRLASFAGPKGEPRTLKITSEHINALLSHVGNRSIVVHKSHNWYGKDDGLNSQVGRLKNHTIDADGNLVADLHLSPGDYRDVALWNAQNDPQGMMLSAVFGYRPDDPKCLPMNYKAADLVEDGAATTALFSAHNNIAKLASMDIQELLTALADPQVKAAIAAILDSHEDAEAIAEAPTPDAVAEMEDAAGIMPSEEEKKDTSPSAMMSRFYRASVAVAKLAKAKTTLTETEETALLTKAEASFTKKIGSGAIQFNIGQANDTKDAEAYITAQLANGCKNRGEAIARMNKDKPEMYAVFRGLKAAA